MRWLRFTLFFIAIVFFFFSFYLWTYRVELIQATIEQACPPYSVSIKSISFTKPVKLNNVILSHNDQKIEIERIELFSTSWVSWFLIPSSEPLHLTSASFHLKSANPPTFDQPHFPFPLSIDTLSVHWPNGSTSTQKAFSNAPLHEILEKVLNHEESTPTLGEK